MERLAVLPHSPTAASPHSDKLNPDDPRGDLLKTARILPFLASLLIALPAASQVKVAPSIVFLSDIHFDPFRDPAKLPSLIKAPAADWPVILAAPPSPTAAADFAALQRTCATRGFDTDWTLLQSSLRAVHLREPSPLFVTVSGDLMAHAFDCRFHQLAPKSTAADYSTFAAKTVAFVAQQLHATFPHVPIYLALGNNDSGCTDYREDPNSAFLQADAQTFAATVLSPTNRDAILKDFPLYGDYNVELPALIEHTRLIVLQDIFESRGYARCSGALTLADRVSLVKSQMDWLTAQLDHARANHDHVWVMAHIPPGINPYATLTKSRNICARQSAETFLGTEALPDALTPYSDVITLALFAHTHMDEMRLLQSASPGSAPIPAKLVSSISPVDGNNPSFTVAQVDPATAILKDYEVYKASNKTGVDTTWAEEYRYSSTYHLPDFSAASLKKLTDTFLADKTGEAPESIAYQTFYFPGDTGLSATLKAAAMHIVWPMYACTIANTNQSAFTQCVCANQPALTAPSAKP